MKLKFADPGLLFKGDVLSFKCRLTIVEDKTGKCLADSLIEVLQNTKDAKWKEKMKTALMQKAAAVKAAYENKINKSDVFVMLKEIEDTLSDKGV